MGSSEGIALITLGAVLLAGYLAYVTGPLIRVPRVTLLLVQEQMPDTGDTVLPLVIGTTVLFEISGPLLARLQLQRSEEWGRGASART
jgi:hypothetical protein